MYLIYSIFRYWFLVLKHKFIATLHRQRYGTESWKWKEIRWHFISGAFFCKMQKRMNRNKVAVEFKVRSCLKVLFGFNFMGFSLSITSFKLPTFCISFLFMMRDHRMVALWLAEWPHTSRVEGKTPASGLCNFTQSA